MTSKRYRKLMRAYLTEVMAGHKDCGRVLKAVRNMRPNFDSELDSYEKMWNRLMEVVDPNTFKVAAQYMYEVNND